MKQVVQTLKDGEVQVIDVPPPLLGPGMILVNNHYSLISSGTETSTLKVARKSLVGKAKQRPDQLKQVIRTLKNQGPLQTYRIVQKKLDEYSPMGYSSAGKIIDVSSDVRGFEPSNLVACGGVGYAFHGEIIAVPVNLCVKLPVNSDLKRAAYNSLGAIALQGIRQADLKIGETCAVIGLGLVGQLTSLILKAGGIKVVGIDIDSGKVDTAKKHCVDLAFSRNEYAIEKKIEEFTESMGVDAVIITATSKSIDPINLAGLISRKRGKIIVVGNVPTGFDREAFYKKELELKMSCSYGPGRYDITYEEKGIDYPVGYVRWTENRNMKAFQDIVQSEKINMDYLTTHVFPIEEAPKAYNLILKKEEPYLGILIDYRKKEYKLQNKIMVGKNRPLKKVNIAFIGTGNYATNHLLPNIPREKGISLKGVLDSYGTISRKTAERFGFEFCTATEADIFENEDVNTVFIASRHDSHADYVIKSLKSGKHVHVEKPLCLRKEELEEIRDVYNTIGRNQNRPLLMVGYNRRFSSFTEILKKHFGDGPMAMLYRINAGPISPESWIQDKDIGGGRIIGEVCHFVDFLTYVNGSLPESVFASVLNDSSDLEDTINIQLKFRNGSIGSISYYSNGSIDLFKEYIEIYKSGLVGVIRDFKNLEIYTDRKKSKKKLFQQDKGQKKMIRDFIHAINEGKASPIKFEDIHTVMAATFRIVESLRQNKKFNVF